MKIKEIKLRNYKRFLQEKIISFCNPQGEVNDVTLITGENGSGKSSVLQAIAILLGGVAKVDFRPNQLEWGNLEYRLIPAGRMPVKVEAKILFKQKEIETAKTFFSILHDIEDKFSFTNSFNKIAISLDYENNKILTKVDNHDNDSAILQFKVHSLAKRYAITLVDKIKIFETAGNIYWYTENRNTYNVSELPHDEVPSLDSIRNFLANAYTFHIALKRQNREPRPGQFDFYEELRKRFQNIFPSRDFIGTTPRFDVYEKSKAPDFFLTDGQNEYELSGMSAGERAIFPILMDFTRWNINNSIIIIDEVALHLHPPLQQAFVRALPKLGKNNQFILTSHSNAVAAMFDESENEIIRL